MLASSHSYMKRLILPLLIAFLLIGGCSDDSDVEERLAALEAENAILKAAAQTGTPDTTTNTPTPTPTAIAHTQTTPTPTPPPRTEPAQSPTATPRIQPTPSPTVTLRTQSTPTPAATPIVWTVIKIIDGDTVDVRSTAFPDPQRTGPDQIRCRIRTLHRRMRPRYRQGAGIRTLGIQQS